MGPATPRSIADLSFRSPLPYYYIFLAVLAVLLGVTWAMERSRMGYYLRAINGGERAAAQPRRAGAAHQAHALLLSAAFTVDRRLALRRSWSASPIPTACSASWSR